jgi:sugar diacid utilization regulator
MLRAMPDLGPVTTWDDLGVFRTLALVREDAGNGVIDPRVHRLLQDEKLAATAERFLDLACDLPETAAQLYVHRTTLYQRLERIAELYKLDLRRSGDHRLITHLGLKFARVSGRQPVTS